MRKTIAFAGTCPARSRVTLASKRITYAYELLAIDASFPAGCQHLLQLSFWLASDPSTPTAAPPTGQDLLAENGQADYLIGDGEAKHLEHGLPVGDEGSYLKVHAYNQDWYDHGVNVQFTMEVP